MTDKKEIKKKIEKLKFKINHNKFLSQGNSELKEKFKEENEKIENEIKELEDIIMTKPLIPNNQNPELGKCQAIVKSTGNPCCNTEAYGGYCLIHLKQKDPQVAEDFQRNRLAKRFGLTEEEIDKIKESNGTLENVSKGLALFIKSQRNKE